ncbi:MAG: ribose-phosphate diphosphokinase [bacterium]|nr:ribose-phosphate diphosphokinase [bacterium]
MQPIVLATLSSAYFGNMIASHLSGRPLDVYRSSFPGGEEYLRIDLHGRGELMGRDVIVVGATHTDQAFEELARIGSAAAGYGARRVIYVIPFFGYSTMERAVKPGEVVVAKLKAKALSALPSGDMRNTFLMMDLHTAGLVHYFEGDCLRFELYAEEVIAQAIADLAQEPLVLGSADLGRPRWVETFAEKFGAELALVRKARSGSGTKALGVIGDVAGKHVVIYDDMVRSGGSLTEAAAAYREHGAASVSAVVSHLALTGPDAVQRIEQGPVAKLIGTNTHPMSQSPEVSASRCIEVRNVSEIFAQAIRRILSA